MSWYIVLAALAIQLLAHLLMPLNLRFSRLHGILAQPGERRIHESSIPEAGGLSFALPIILIQLIFAFVFRHIDS